MFCSPVRFLGRGDRGIDTARRVGTTLTVTTLREIGRLMLYSMCLDRHKDERVTNDPQPRDTVDGRLDIEYCVASGRRLLQLKDNS